MGQMDALTEEFLLGAVLNLMFLHFSYIVRYKHHKTYSKRIHIFH